MKVNAAFVAMLLAKARAEEMHDFSDTEIQRVFSHTVAPNECIAAFRSLVDAGLQPDDLNKDFDTLVEQVINLRPIF